MTTAAFLIALAAEEAADAAFPFKANFSMAAASISKPLTAKPALKSDAAIPWPMAPSPTMPIVLTSPGLLVGVGSFVTGSIRDNSLARFESVVVYA